MVTEYIEKRIDKRAPHSEEAKFKILGEPEQTTAYNYEKAETKNISKGGVCMSLPYKINEGNVIRVEIPLEKDGAEKKIKAFCEVQWCNYRESEKRYEVGMSFIALKEDDAEYLRAYVQERAM